MEVREFAVTQSVLSFVPAGTMRVCGRTGLCVRCVVHGPAVVHVCCSVRGNRPRSPAF